MPHASGKRNKHLTLFGLKERITKWRAFRLGSWFRGCLNVAYDEVHVPSSKSCSLFAACLIGALLLLSYPYLGIFGRSWLMIPGQRNRCIFYIVPTLYLHCTYFASTCVLLETLANKNRLVYGELPNDITPGITLW
jgi:hypothetical protein